MVEYGDYMQRQELEFMRKQMEKDPGSVEYYFTGEIEFFIQKEREGFWEPDFWRKESPHIIYNVYPLDWGGCCLHRFKIGNESFSSLTEGCNGKEYLLCRRRYELDMLEYFHRNQEMILTKSTEENKNTIEENDLWQPEI